MAAFPDLNDLAETLQRYPRSRDKSLRAWDAADEYILRHLEADDTLTPAGRILVANDSFGALAVALANRPLTWWNDSHLAARALAANLAANRKQDAEITVVPADQIPKGKFELVIIKIPKSIDLFEDMLLRIRNGLEPGTALIAGGMIKHTPTRAYRLLEKIIGPTRTGLGWKKARLAFAGFDPDRDLPPHLEPRRYELPDLELTLTNRPGVFAGQGLDPGTRLLAAHLPVTDLPWRVADLGCGNGVLALVVARQCPAASILGVDESHMAVASARQNQQHAGLENRDLRFEVGDGLAETEGGSLDLVVCNPPFHQAQAVGDHLAWRMFEQAKRALKTGGELRLVGNRHLGYHVKLKRLFGNCEVLASDPKFVVLCSRR
ncbi:MAG: methyltransferase [Candidatus Krumholzibacteriota bacterium]